MHRKYVVEGTCKKQDNKGVVVVFENTKENGYKPKYEATAEELTEILDEFYIAPIKALKEARDRILNDKKIFVNCGRTNTLGFDRSIMLIDELIEEMEKSGYAKV